MGGLKVCREEKGNRKDKVNMRKKYKGKEHDKGMCLAFRVNGETHYIQMQEFRVDNYRRAF